MKHGETWGKHGGNMGETWGKHGTVLPFHKETREPSPCFHTLTNALTVPIVFPSEAPYGLISVA